MKSDYISIHIAKAISCRETLIDYILNGKWLNKTWERSYTILIEDTLESKAVQLRLERSQEKYEIGAVVQKEQDSDWIDVRRVLLLKGSREFIREEISEEFYRNLLIKLLDILNEKA